MQILYNSFFISSGTGESDISNINAFDEALNYAGISECNLVKVSSILPEKPKEIKYLPNFKIGEIVHCVLARLDGNRGDCLSAGLGIAIGTRSDGKEYGFVMEAEGHCKAEDLESDLRRRLDDMAIRRNFNIKEKKVKVANINNVNSEYGSAVVVLVYRNI